MTNEERDALIAQGWTPPQVADPDLLELETLWLKYTDGKINSLSDVVLAGIKRGRELERAEAKPGMVWVKHDGSRQSPVPGALVTVSVGHSHYETDQSFMIDWWRVSHYAIITPPEDK